MMKTNNIPLQRCALHSPQSPSSRTFASQSSVGHHTLQPTIKERRKKTVGAHIRTGPRETTQSPTLTPAVRFSQINWLRISWYRIWTPLAMTSGEAAKKRLRSLVPSANTTTWSGLWLCRIAGMVARPLQLYVPLEGPTGSSKTAVRPFSPAWYGRVDAMICCDKSHVNFHHEVRYLLRQVKQRHTFRNYLNMGGQALRQDCGPSLHSDRN